MAKKKISIKNLKAQQLSEKEQLRTKGGFYDHSINRRKGVSFNFNSIRPSIIEDTIDIRFNENDGFEKSGE